MNAHNSSLKSALTLLFCGIVTACGGGGGSGTEPPEPPIPNSAPIVQLGENISANEDTTVSITATASDSDGSIASYTWSQTSGPDVTISGGDSATIEFLAPQVSENEILNFQLAVTDDDGATATDTIEVEIINVNQIPTVSAGDDFSVNENSQVTLNVATTDDGQIVSYDWQQIEGPTVELLEGQTATATFTAPEVTATTTFSFEITVTDDLGSNNSDTITVEVNNINKLPVVNAGEDQTVNENSEVNLTATATDIDGQITSYSWTQTTGSNVVLDDSNNADISFIAPDINIDEVLTFSVTVSDNEGATATDNVSIQVLRVNQLPSVDAGVNQSVNENTSVTLTANANDNDGEITNYSWTQTAGTNVILTNNNSATASFTAPDINVDETLTFSVTATDNDGATATDSVSIQVLKVNQLPTVTIEGTTLVSELEQSSLTANANDSDGTIVSYNWSQTSGPAAILENTTNATLTFTAPDLINDESVIFSVIVTDSDGGSVTASVNVLVLGSSQTLTLDAGDDQTVEKGANVTLTASASDSAGEIISYQWQQISGTTVTLDTPQNASTSFVAPQVDEQHTLSFVVRVNTDYGATSIDFVDVHINSYTSPPTVDAGEDQIVSENTNVTLIANAVAHDSQIVSTVWQQTAGTEVSIDNPFTNTINFTAPDVNANETLTFTVTITDNYDVQATDSVDVFVKNEILPPTVNAGEDQTVNENTTVTLSATANQSEGEIVSYNWTQTAGLDVTLTNADSANASFAAPNIAADETFTFSVTVTDNFGGTATDSVNVNIIDLEEPVVDAGENQSVIGETTVTLTATASISTGDLTYQWSQTSGTSVTFSNSNALTTTFTAPATSIEQTLAFEFTATSTEGASSSDTVQITVTPTVDRIDQLTFEYSGLTECVRDNAQANGWTYINEMTELDCVGLTSTVSSASFVGIDQLYALEKLSGSCITYYTPSEYFEPIINHPNINNVELNYCEYVQFDGFAAMENLTRFKLYKASFNGHSALAGLTNVKELILDTIYPANNVISHIQNLTQIETLLINDAHEEVNIDWIGNLSNLKQLTLTDNFFANTSYTGISAIAALSKLEAFTLTDVTIDSSDLSFISPLNQLKKLHINKIAAPQLPDMSQLNQLSELTLADLGLTDISPLADLTTNKNQTSAITKLDLSNNSITDTSALSQMTQLIELDLSNNQVNDISALGNSNLITQLDLANNQITDISALATNTELTKLTLDHNDGINDLSAVANMTKLNYFSKISYVANQISDISGFANAPNLTHIDVSGAPVNDISWISALSELQYFKIGSDQLTDITALQQLSKLETLSLQGTEDNRSSFNDLSQLAALTQLKQLDLQHNSFSDLTPVANLTETKVNVRKNPNISCEAAYQIKQQRPELFFYDDCQEFNPQWRIDLDYYNRTNNRTIGFDQHSNAYIASPTEIIKVDPQGQILWRNSYPTLADSSQNAQFSTTPLITSDGTIIVTSSSKELLAINSDGSILWQYTLLNSATNVPAIDAQGVIYFGDSDNNLYAVSAQGELQWRIELFGSVYFGVTIDSNNHIYLSTDSGKSYAIDQNGDTLWMKQIMYAKKPVVGADGTIFIPGNNLYAFNSSGEQLWHNAEVSSNWLTIDHNNQLYSAKAVINYDGTLARTREEENSYPPLLTQSGHQLYSFGDKIWVYNSSQQKIVDTALPGLNFYGSDALAIAPNNVIYHLDDQGKLSTFTTTFGEISTGAWPSIYQNNRNTNRVDSVTPMTNQPPQVSTGDDIETTNNGTIELTAQASDPDGQIVKYQWVQLDQNSVSRVTIENADTLNATFTADINGYNSFSYRFSLTATDDQGASSSDTIQVVVRQAH